MRLRSLLAAASLATFALAAAPARADGVDLETRSAARKLGVEGQKLFDATDFSGALEKFNLADSLVPAPTLGLRAARCLVKLGRLVEASERYLDVTRAQLDRFAPAVMRKAQGDALAERDKLLPTIPSLSISVTGPLGAGVTVLVDDKPVPPALLGQRRPLDPGTHKIEARRVDTKVARDIVLKSGEAGQVALELPPLPAKPKPPDTFPYRPLGFSGVAVGAAGLVFGGVSGVLALTNEQSLLGQCGADRLCPPSAWSQSHAYDLMRAFTTVGLVVGGVGLAAGIPFLILAPSPPKKDAPAVGARIEPWIGLGGAGLRGNFEVDPPPDLIT